MWGVEGPAAAALGAGFPPAAAGPILQLEALDSQDIAAEEMAARIHAASSAMVQEQVGGGRCFFFLGGLLKMFEMLGKAAFGAAEQQCGLPVLPSPCARGHTPPPRPAQPHQQSNAYMPSRRHRLYSL